MTQSTPSRMTRTITTRTICTSEHSSGSLVVFHVSLIMCHTTLAQVVRVSVIFTPCRTCVVLLDSLRPPLLLQPVLPRPSFSPLSSCTLTCTPTSTTWTPWKITCATPPRGGNDAYDVTFSLTGYEPNDTVSNEVGDSQGSFSYITPSSDLDIDDATLGKLLDDAHRGQADYCDPEGVSVSQSVVIVCRV